MPPTIEARHLISPNIHAILVHAPLGLFMFGLFLEVFGLLLFRKSQVRQAARWMLLFGGLMAVPAALSGIDAYHDVSEHAVRTEVVNRVKLKVRGVSDVQYEYMRKHVLYTSVGAGLAALGVTAGLGLSLRRLNHKITYTLVLLVLIGAATLMGVGAHFGGEGVYIQSVAVGVTTGGAEARTLEWYAPARETHIAMAGLAMAAALGALGATWRLLSTFSDRREEAAVEKELASLGTTPGEPAPFGQRRVTEDMIVARTLNADTQVSPPRMPAARFWLLSSLIFVVALAFGVLFLQNDQWHTDPTAKVTPASIVQLVKTTANKTEKTSENRQAVHIVLGIALVLYPLLLAFAARFLARARWLVAGMCLVMVLLIGAEIWVGVLLSYRGASGTMMRFPSVPVSTDTDQ